MTSRSASELNSGTDQRTNSEQPIVKAEMQKAKDRAVEMARAKHKSFGVDLLFLGVEAAWDYVEALDDARDELWRGELDALKAEVERHKRVIADLKGIISEQVEEVAAGRALRKELATTIRSIRYDHPLLKAIDEYDQAKVADLIDGINQAAAEGKPADCTCRKGLLEMCPACRHRAEEPDGGVDGEEVHPWAT